MSLTIRESLVKLATKLGIDASDMPASNIADCIDYITEEFDGTGAHNGVIADAFDQLDIPVESPE